jgi:hypothetical protein
VAFVLFLLATAVLFIRPTDFIPPLQTVPLYEGLVAACLVAAIDGILRQLRGDVLSRDPISACVLGLLPAVVLSELANLDFEGASTQGLEFGKVVLFYLLLVGTVDSPRRLRACLLWLGLCLTVVTGIGVLQYYGVVQLESFAILEEVGAGTIDPDTGAEVVTRRLRGSGLFCDPNDLCLVLDLAIPAALYGLGDRRLGPLRALWLGPLLLFGVALALTQSRGGLLGALVGVVVLLRARFRGRGGIVLGAVVLPVLLKLFGGRQTDFEVSGGTGQQRIQIWFESLGLFLKRPAFGIGASRLLDHLDHVTHNSFLHCFTELGLCGGVLFLGAYVHALGALDRLGPDHAAGLDPELRRMRPYVLAAVAGYAAGMLTLSVPYIVPTYTLLGLAAGYLRAAEADQPGAAGRAGGAFARRTAAASGAFLVAMFIYTKLFVNW